MSALPLFATAPKGIEPLLAKELRALGAVDARETRGGVRFTGNLEFAYRACLWSRLAHRILLPLAEFPAADADALYAGVQGIDWSAHLDASRTLAVDVTGIAPAIAHTHYAAQRAKDAIVDQFRAAGGSRPSVDTAQPDLRIHLHLQRDTASLALDLSGESLHRRGYRTRGVAAPLKENLAAAILLRAGWPAIAAEGGPLLDPMCGSATLLIEGAFMAGDVAPGLLREYWGFLGWRGHDAALWTRLREEAAARREDGLTRLPRLLGHDADRQAIHAALENIAAAGLSGRVHVERRDLARLAPPDGPPGLLVANPPYGERLGEAQALAPLYAALGRALRERFTDWRAAVFTGNPELGRQLGLRAVRLHTLYNGPIPCKLLQFEVRADRFTGADRPDAPAGTSPDTPGSTAVHAPGAQMFANRLRKNLKTLRRWIEREQICCYRLYDADMPEYALAIDVYEARERWLHVQEYAAPGNIDPAAAQRRLAEALQVLPEVLEVPVERVAFKVRQRQKGRQQYTRLAETGRFHEVREGPCQLLVNFTDYLDTGLFLDHRPTRALIREWAAGQHFLNLFAYTGTATVHAAVGGARSTTSVDLSATYLDWARRNLALNGFAKADHTLIRADARAWLAEQALQRGPRRRYGLIFLDPPSFSTSKRMQGTLDIQRDHVALIRDAVQLLAPGGTLVFSNNLRSFRLDTAALAALSLDLEDITARTLPPDFARNPRIHRCWRIRPR